MKWLVGGTLISFGLVGFLTGLVLVPFGIACVVWAATTERSQWPGLVVGLGIGPVVLLSNDVAKETPPAGAVPVFWIGVALLVVGLLLAARSAWTARRRSAV